MNIDIQNIYVGDSSISRMYQGSELIYENSHPDILLNYIANGPDGGSANPDVYFSTGVAPLLYTAVEFKFEASTIADGRIFGCGNASTASTMYNFNMYGSGTTAEGGTKTSMKFFYRGGNLAASITPQANTPYTVSLWGTNSGNTANAMLMTVNGTMYQRSVTIGANITDSASAWIFRWNGNQDPSTPSGVKFYYVKMWNNNNLVRFYIPVLHWLNGHYVPCFYDKVTNIYIYNQGSGQPTYKISDDYLLNYIKASSNNALSYDTGVDVARGLGIDVRFSSGNSISSNNINENIIVGVRYDGSNKYGIYAPYAGISGNPSANWYVGLKGLGYNLSASTPGVFNTNYTVSTSPNMGSKNLFVDGTTYTAGTSESSTAAVIGSRIGIFGIPGQYSFKDTLVNYCIITNTIGSGRTPACSMIPVLHNGIACFYDVDKGTYTYNSRPGTPYYQFLSSTTS